MSSYSTDSFNRTNSLTTLGSTDGAGSLDPLTWTAQAGVWGITSNQADLIVGISNDYATVNLTHANVDISLTLPTLGDAGLCFRFSDASNVWILKNNSGSLNLIKRASGSETSQGTVSGNANGDVIRVVASGSNIDVYRNGTLKYTVVDSFNSTATNHGLYSNGDLVATFDSWSVSTLALTVSLADADSISETKLVKTSTSRSDTLSLSETTARAVAEHKSLSNTVSISNILAIHPHVVTFKTNIVSISETLTVRLIPINQFSSPTNIVDINDNVVVRGNYIQYDTWRPVTKPDNNLVLVCRTPVGEHDSYTGLTHLSLWTLNPQGGNERKVVLTPASNGYGWTSFVHPEWSPDGNSVVIAAETTNNYKLFVINSSAFGQ